MTYPGGQNPNGPHPGGQFPGGQFPGGPHQPPPYQQQPPHQPPPHQPPPHQPPPHQHQQPYPPGHPQPPYPSPYHAPQAPPPAKSRNRIIALVVSLAVLFVACLSVGAYGAIKAVRDDAKPSKPRPILAAPTEDAPTSAAPTAQTPRRPAGVTGTVPAGSKASTLKLRQNRDLERVCDRWYYPKAPKYTTSLSPHPIVISSKERKDLDFRTTTGYLSVPYDSPAAVRAAWQPKTPAAVQLVACADLVTTGAKVKNCRIDKPKPSSIGMKEGTYRLSLYEVATRRKLFETRMVGEKEDCPLFIFIGNDRSVYTRLEDQQLVDALRRFVEE